ncbi:hypothetical protein QLX08_010195 [Tetragonisca angustula]|uniref:Secreted protein n=1 Tax=Tetragonisca angustula TaxID=166442 RepID=A0AAW0ZCZ1_9HYME
MTYPSALMQRALVAAALTPATLTTTTCDSPISPSAVSSSTPGFSPTVMPRSLLLYTLEGPASSSTAATASPDARTPWCSKASMSILLTILEYSVAATSPKRILSRSPVHRPRELGATAISRNQHNTEARATRAVVTTPMMRKERTRVGSRLIVGVIGGENYSCLNSSSNEEECHNNSATATLADPLGTTHLEPGAQI